MEIDLKSLPVCFIHKKQIVHICSCMECRIPNPMICSDPDCMKAHGHALQQIIPLDKLRDLLDRNTASMKMLMQRTREYYEQLRAAICHEVAKVEELMVRALEYKHTHATIGLLRMQKFNQISPQKMFQLVSYLRGAKTQRKSMEFVKNEVCQTLDKLQVQKKKLFESADFKKLMLYDLIDISSTFEMSIDRVNTSILDSEQEFRFILKNLQIRNKKVPTGLDLLYRASDQDFSANSYLLSIQQRGPLLFMFKTDLNKKFGCFLNSKVDKKQGWMTDGPGFSFIFSLDHESILPIRQQAKCRVKALYVGQKGPQLGSGCDIYISDKSNENKDSGSNLGASFELPAGIKFGSREAKEFLAGEELFRVVEYEVYEVK